MTTEKRVWQYNVRGELGEWACVLLREDGLFSAVSSYGNYAYFWSSIGFKDAREFFARDTFVDWDYFAKKFDPEEVLDPDLSFAALKRHICEQRRDHGSSKEEARDAFDFVREYERFNDWEGVLREHGGNFGWEPSEFTVTVFKTQVRLFAQNIMPALAKMIRAELDRVPEVTRVQVLAKNNFHIEATKRFKAAGDVRGDRWYPDLGEWHELPTKSFEGLQELLKTFEGSADLVIHLEDGAHFGYRLERHRLTEMATKLSLVAQ